MHKTDSSLAQGFCPPVCERVGEMEENGVEDYFLDLLVHQKIKGELKTTDSWAPSLEADLIKNGRV